jgi:replicative superfamily II helicase
MTSGFGAGLVIPDLWQREAVRALQQGKDVVVQAPTGSGKTYIFELLYPNLKTQAVFTVPTRALANDKLSEWRARSKPRHSRARSHPRNHLNPEALRSSIIIRLRYED